MGILDGLFEKRALPLDDAGPWRSAGILRPTAAGVSVSGEGALKLSAVYAAVRVLSETVASLPLLVYERQADGSKQRAPNFYLYDLLHREPNPYQTSFEFRENLVAHLALWGNAYCEIELDGRGRVAGLWPLRPDRMLRVFRQGGQVRYRYQLPDGGTVTLSGDQVWHLRLMGDGLQGYSPIGLARQSVGLGLAAEHFGADFFGNGARPGGVLEHPGELGEEGMQNLRTGWESAHGGLGRSNRVAILEEGMTYKAIGVPPDDAQFLETRKFQVEEIARIFRVPLHMVGMLDRATFSNIEHQSIDFVVHTIRPWLVRIEQSIGNKLMTARDRSRYFAEFLVDGLLRGDVESRYQAYATGRQNGWLSANDIRRLENMNPIEGGDVYLVPLNMVPADEIEGGDRDRGGARERFDVEMEKRSRRAMGNRRRLSEAQVVVFADVLARILRREINDVSSGVRKLLKRTDLLDDVRDWLSEFYTEHETFIRKQVTPSMHAYIELVQHEAMNEIGLDEAELVRFERSYIVSYAARHAGRSIKQIMRALEAIGAPLITSDQADDALAETFDKWREQRPNGDAADEAVRLGNATAKYVYITGGIQSVRWQAFGDSCPYCNKLNGRTVPIYDNFLSAGQPLTVEDEDKPPLVPGRNIGHPPTHRGCDCMLVSA